MHVFIFTHFLYSDLSGGSQSNFTYHTHTRGIFIEAQLTYQYNFEVLKETYANKGKTYNLHANFVPDHILLQEPCAERQNH